MKLKHIFLVTSACMAFHIAASHNNDRQDSFNDIPTNNSSQESSKTSNGSNIFTTVRYGLGKWFAGETAAGAYFKMNEDGTLKGDVENNPAQAINRLNDATRERFTHKTRTLTDRLNQQKIYDIFSIALNLKTATKKDFGVAKIVAQEYNPLQKTALQEITQLHALETEPQLRKERDDAIEVAKTIYQSKMTDVLTFAAQASFNKRYLHEQSESQELFELQDAKHYLSITTYKTLLESIRSTHSIIEAEKEDKK